MFGSEKLLHLRHDGAQQGVKLEVRCQRARDFVEHTQTVHLARVDGGQLSPIVLA